MAAIKIVKQEADSLNCGIACVAMLRPDLSYKKIKNKMLKQKGKITRTSARELVVLCKSLKLDAEIKRTKSWGDISSVAIVGVNPEKGKEKNFHWVLCITNNNKSLIVDPNPDDGDVYQGKKWQDTKDGYWHRGGYKEYVAINITVNSISI
ncbi:MAG: cysteine peptidase family C39 domain-containing protein [Maricaulaceae bacterium]